MYCKNKVFWLLVNSNGVIDNVKLCVEYVWIFYKIIFCYKVY